MKRKREKAAGELKVVKLAKREAERRCSEMETEREAISDDYESRLQQQVFCGAVFAGWVEKTRGPDRMGSPNPTRPD